MSTANHHLIRHDILKADEPTPCDNCPTYQYCKEQEMCCGDFLRYGASRASGAFIFSSRA